MASLTPYSITLGATDYPVKYAGLLSYVEPYLTNLETFTFSGGNVGLGVTPSAWGSQWRALQINTGASVYGSTTFTIIGQNVVGQTGTDNYISSAPATRYIQNAGAHIWNTAPSGTAGNAISFTQAMTLTSGGDLLVGTTAAAANNGSIGVKGIVGFTGGTAGTYYYTIQSNTTDFYIGNTNLTRYAALVGITTFTAWTFASDRRIKQDIADIDYGLDAVMAIRPRKYKFKDSHQNSIGFIAQELKQVIPDAVTGEELEFNDTDTAQERAKKTMGVSKDLLIPVLVKAIQEQQALITALTARVAALEQA